MELSTAGLFKTTPALVRDGTCSYVKPFELDVLQLDSDDVDRVNDLWGFFLLGCFAGRFPSLKAVHNLVSTWKTECTILPHQYGWVLFQFQSNEELERVLAGGPYSIYGHTLLLRTLPENFCFHEEDYNIVPIWVQLHNLPPQCWNIRAISKISSKIGKPIYVDNFTLERRRFSYACVLVEIDTCSSPTDVFDVKLPSGVVYSQYVHYENLPKFCNYCFMFGHLRDNCNHLYPQAPKSNHNENIRVRSLIL